jgi:hypothetical protein
MRTSASYRGLMADARFTYRPAFDAQLFTDNASMRTWSAGLHVGMEF